ncbi:hypothetical protein [Ideonella livida]|uniref:Glycosyl transferase n=1 Tax=Ideonella livida TaxID=2707176 RepID=A0A7C9PG87_9BURK|nr:hypothetical protein [Ideonella livida]NDY90889.1 hypothetical protein [Ideonella livida]
MNDPLSAPDSVLNVYIGCEAPQAVAAKVLTHSILRHAQAPGPMRVQVQRLDECTRRLGLPLGWHTLFSLQRFCIPLLNDYQGTAVYLDSDMLVFDDIRSLLRWRDPAVAVCSAAATPDSGRKPQYSVLLIDCARARWAPEQARALAAQDYLGLMTRLSLEPSKAACLPYTWNSLERWEPVTGLLHYTAMNLQPWISSRNPLAPLWFEALFEALDEGAVTPADLEEAHRHRWVRPGLMWQVEHREPDPRRVPWHLLAAELAYVPPHRPPLRARLATWLGHGRRPRGAAA